MMKPFPRLTTLGPITSPILVTASKALRSVLFSSELWREQEGGFMSQVDTN